MFVARVPGNIFNAKKRYSMSYGKFVQELNRGIEGKIAAYAETDDEDGCWLYLRDANQKIFVTAEVVDHRRDESILLLRAKIREGMRGAPIIVLKLLEDELMFEEGVTVQENPATGS